MIFQGFVRFSWIWRPEARKLDESCAPLLPALLRTDTGFKSPN